MAIKKVAAWGMAATSVVGAIGASAGGYIYATNELPPIPILEALPSEEMPAPIPATGNVGLLCPANIPDCNVKDALAYTKIADYQPLGTSAVAAVMQNAVKAKEDKNFMERPDAIDAQGLARAIKHNAQEWISSKQDDSQVVEYQGASTIEMQATSLKHGLPKSPTLHEKIQEMRMARRMLLDTPGATLQEKKDIIMRDYLDRVYFGREANGITAAAEKYFNTTPDKLNIPQAAILTALIREPSNMDNTDNPTELARLQANQAIVLDAMADEGYITEAEANEWKDQSKHPLTSYTKPYNPRPDSQWIEGMYAFRATSISAEHYTQMALSEAKEILREHDPTFNGEDLSGYKIVTSLNTRNQQVARDAARTVRLSTGEEVALTQIDPHGAVLAMLGGNYKQSQVNLVIASRPLGSLMKVFYLTAALEKDVPISHQHTVPSKVLIPMPHGKPWEVKGATCIPACDMQKALASSVNGWFALDAKEALDANEPRIQDMQRIARELGMKFQPNENLSSVLGTVEDSTLNTTQAFNNLMRQQGQAQRYFLISKITNQKGETIYEYNPKEEQQAERIVSLGAAYQIIDLARGPVEPGGTAYNSVTLARRGVDIAGKTGTTENNADGWFTGTTYAQGTATVHIFNPKGQIPTSVQGGQQPAQIWNQFMSNLPQDTTHKLDERR